MEKQANSMDEGADKRPPAKMNRGWFKPGDQPISLEGRPRGSKVETEGRQVCCASNADRVKLLFVPGRVLRCKKRCTQQPPAMDMTTGKCSRRLTIQQLGKPCLPLSNACK
jgi:hypothetical protein